MKIGSFSAASNITGVTPPVDDICILLHKYGALSFWDYASAAPYSKVDMNPYYVGEDRELVYKDAIFISAHKFIGGMGAPGIIISKRDLFNKEFPPSTPGGGTVFFVCCFFV